jgi:hypothetical protein
MSVLTELAGSLELLQSCVAGSTTGLCNDVSDDRMTYELEASGRGVIQAVARHLTDGTEESHGKLC